MGRGDARIQANFPAGGKRSIVSGASTMCARQTAKLWRKAPKGIFDTLNRILLGAVFCGWIYFLRSEVTVSVEEGYNMLKMRLYRQQTGKRDVKHGADLLVLAYDARRGNAICSGGL